MAWTSWFQRHYQVGHMDHVCVNLIKLVRQDGFSFAHQVIYNV